ncbi:hypothetical protein [Sneathiella glossodoripedis]|uniref:hypothetical protein n=1 Tax=Sneathiella glossodoripedis TaxID=418853 RepID=UPI0004714215|nr:hypothetical protein [Sneathiella glossodoripedis]
MKSKDLLDEIQSMKGALSESLTRAQQGEEVDISRLPDRLMLLHTEVQKLEGKDQEQLTKGLEDLLDLLDELSKEIHKKYEDVSRQIKMLDG